MVKFTRSFALRFLRQSVHILVTILVMVLSSVAAFLEPCLAFP